MKQLVRLVSVMVAAAAPLLAQDSKTPVDDRVIELPKFVVTDTRELPPPESWRYATIAGFEVLSNASEKATQRLIRDFDMFRQALGYAWPVPNRITQNTALIICGKGNKFDAFLTGKGGAGIDFANLGGEANKASLFLRKGNQAAIIIDLQATTLNVLNIDGANDAATGTDSSQISVEHDKQLYREYVRYLMSQHEPRSPAWLEEGLSQILMKMTFDRRFVEFARIEEPNTISAQAAMVQQLNALSTAEDPEAPTLPGAPAEDRDFNVALRRRALVPLDKFFAVKHDSPEASNPLGNNRWAKQAYAFVHMCLYGYKGKYQKPFATFVQRSGREPVTEAMFKEVFNKSYKDMLMEIRSYSEFTVYEVRYLEAKKGEPDLIIPPKALALREATQAEIGRIKGEAMVLAGNVKSARSELIAPYIRGERDPNLLAAIALYEKAHGEAERAEKFLQGAYAGKTTRADANIEVARQRYAAALAAPAAPEGRFSAAQVASVLEPLQRARKTPPPLPAVYDLAGDALMRSAVEPKKEEAVFLVEGAQLYPTRFKIIFQAAVIAARAGENQPAHALVDHGLKYVPDPAVKKRFEELKAALPPAAAGPESKAEPVKSEPPAKAKR